MIETMNIGFNRPPTIIGFPPVTEDPYQALIASASAYWTADKADGEPWVKLEPRTLPNGVSNGEYTQNVSVDVVITRAMVGNLNNRVNFTQVQILRTSLTPEPVPFLDAIQGIFHIPNWTEKARAITGEYVPNRYATRSADSFFSLEFDLPLGTTLEQARDILAGIVIRYQLATPIDRLNVPFKNSLIDNKGVVGKNLFDPAVMENGTTGTGGELLNSTQRLRNKLDGRVRLKPNTTYIVSVTGIGYERLTSNLYNVDGTFISNVGPSFTTPSTETFYMLVIRKSDNSTITPQEAFNAQIQLELGSVATAYAPYGKANCLLQGFAGTSADGYTVQTINGKTNTFLNLDGVNSFGSFANMDVLNPQNQDDFAQLVVFRPDDLGTRYFGVVRNNENSATMQYGMYQNATTLQVIINGQDIAIPSIITQNLQYVIYGRISGERFVERNNIEIQKSLYNVSVTSRANTQMACRSNSVDGLTKVVFGKGLQGDIFFWKGAQGTLNKAKIVDLARKGMKYKYNLGV
jgi:hypothetical protein